MAMQLGRNFGRYVSASGKGAAFSMRETAITTAAPKSYCTSSTGPRTEPTWISRKIVDFITGIGMQIILPCSAIYWIDGNTGDPYLHRKVAALKERFQLIRNRNDGEGDKK